MPTLTFTTSGTWQALASVIDCQCTGEGGNGGSGLHNSHSGGGGGGGEYAEETALALTVNNNYTYTIGNGGSTTNTVFPGDSTTVTANFGGSAPGQPGGSAGTGSSNSIHFNGAAGASGTLLSGSHPGGAGGDGSGPGGVGTGGNGGNGGAAGGNGQPGAAPGGGGGGGGKNSTTNPGGGPGAAGQIIIIYTASVSGTATLTGTGTLTAAGSVFTGGNRNSIPVIAPGYSWRRHFAAFKTHLPPPFSPPAPAVTVQGTATLSGVGSLSGYGSVPGPDPAVVNQWAGGYGQGTTFTTITSALQSVVVPLNMSSSVGGGSGVPTPGNWLFTIVSWTQTPAIAQVHIGVGDDAHSWWRESPASQASGNTRTSISYTPNILGTLQNIYVAPDMEISAISVLVVEANGLGPWDTVFASSNAYTGSGTSLNVAVGANASFSFVIAGFGGNNTASGQAFLPAGWQPLVTQKQTNGANHLADNILTAAYIASTGTGQSVTATASTAESLSGFIIAMYVNGASPIPAHSNPNWPHVIFEAGFGSGFNTPDSEVTWTDISARLWDWDETTGIQFQLGQLQSTNLTLHLDDLDGFLIPTNTSSPYYPNVTPGTPVRLRAALGTMAGVPVNRWYIIQRNAAQWSEEIDEVFRRYCSVSATDLWAALSSTAPTFYRSEVYEDSPYAWWPCDDQPGSFGVLPVVLLNAAQGNTNTLNINVSPNGAQFQPVYNELGASSGSVFPGSAGASIAPGVAIYTVGANSGWMFGDPLSSPASLGTGNPEQANPGSASWQATGQTGSTGSYGWYLICNDSSFPALSAGITVEVWFKYQFYGSADGFQTNAIGFGNFAPQVQQPYNCPLTILELATTTAPLAVLQLNTAGHLTMNGNAIYSQSDLRSDSWHMITMTLTTTQWHVLLDGGVNADVSGSASFASSWQYLIANADFGGGGGGSPSAIAHGGNAAFAHIAVYPLVLPYFRILDHYWAAVTAFGQLPAPTGTVVSWTLNATTTDNQTTGSYAPDGKDSGNYATQSGTALSARVAARAPGITSVASGWNTGSAAGITVDIGTGTGAGTPWVGWTGLAPQFEVYMSVNPGGETGAALVNGSGDAFASGYGGSATSSGVCAMGPGDGSSPPNTATSIGDQVGQRIERLMRGGRCSSPNRCIDPAPLLVQAPGINGSGAQVGANIQAIQQSDDGMLFVDNCNHLTYWQRPHLASQYSSPVWNIGPTTSASRIPYHKEVRWVTDPQRIFNVIAVTPLSPSGAALASLTPGNVSAVNTSQIRYGAQPLTVSSWLQSTTEMQSQANWLFLIFGTPQRHMENVMIDAAAYPLAWQLILGVNIGDIVQCEDWIIGGGGPVYTYRVTELQRHIAQGFGEDPATTASVVLTLDFEPTTYWT